MPLPATRSGSDVAHAGTLQRKANFQEQAPNEHRMTHKPICRAPDEVAPLTGIMPQERPRDTFDPRPCALKGSQTSGARAPQG